MKSWWTARDLAGLPGLPGSAFRVRDRATREGWRSRQQRSSGGRPALEYHVHSLPEATRQHLAAEVGREARTSTEGSAPAPCPAAPEAPVDRAKLLEDGLRRFAAASARKQTRARAREWVLRAWASYQASQNVSADAGLTRMLRDLVACELAIPPEHARLLPGQAGVPHLTRSTLYRWRAAYEAEGLGGLLAGYGCRQGESRVDQEPELRRVVLGLMHAHPHITGRKVQAYLRAAHKDLPRVGTRTLDRWMAAWKRDNAAAWTAVTDPDAWKSRYMPAFGSQHEGIERLNQLWELDSTPGDWMLTDGRHAVIGVIDMWSRRLKLHVSKTSKAQAVATAFRRAVLAWGVPEEVRTDNGKDYVAERFRTVLDGLGVGQRLCLPFASEEKATIERAFRTMAHGILELLPGFIGHNVAERKAIEGRLGFAARVMGGEAVEVALSAAELQERLDQWCEHIYGRDAHGGLDGESPWDRARQWTGDVRRVRDERALDMLLEELVERTVRKKGLRIDHGWYIAPELGVRVGERVQVRRDPEELGRVYVFTAGGDFVCQAERPEATGISRREVAAVAKKSAQRLQRQHAKERREAQREFGQGVVEAVLRARVEESANVLAFPSASDVEHTTAALEGAGEAARSVDGPVAAAAPDVAASLSQQAATAARFQEEIALLEARRPAAAVVSLETSRDRFQRWVRSWRRHSAGERLTGEDEVWMRSYGQTVECRTELEVHVDFGLVVDGEPITGADEMLHQVGRRAACR